MSVTRNNREYYWDLFAVSSGDVVSNQTVSGQSGSRGESFKTPRGVFAHGFRAYITETRRLRCPKHRTAFQDHISERWVCERCSVLSSKGLVGVKFDGVLYHFIVQMLSYDLNYPITKNWLVVPLSDEAPGELDDQV